MHATLEIDDDVLEAAKGIARQSGRTAGAVLSELARRALTTVPGKQTPAGIGGFMPFERRGSVVTTEQIDRLREQDTVVAKVGSLHTARDVLRDRAGSAKPRAMLKYLRRAPKVAPTAGDER